MDDPRIVALAKRLRTAREAAGISANKLSRLTDVSRESILEIEKGRQPPRLTTLFKLADALKVDPANLLAGLNDVDVQGR